MEGIFAQNCEAEEEDLRASEAEARSVAEDKNSAPDNTMDTGETLSGERNDTATPQDTVSDNKNSDNFGETSTPVEESTENIARIDEVIAGSSGPLTQKAADSLVLAMEAGAEQDPAILFSDEEWENQFPENRVSTPIGEIKLGENQKTKLEVKNRKGQFGMMKPTMENPDVILYEEDLLPPDGAARTGKILFIKTFIGKDGRKHINFESVTARIDNLEISVSSHIVEKDKLLEKLQTDRVVYMREALFSNSSEGRLAEQNESVPDLVPTQENSATSDNKGSDISEENNTPAENPTVEAIKRQAVREGGQILVLPSEEEAGGLPSRTHELSSGSKDSENPEETNTPERKRAACLRPAGWEIGSRQHFASFYQSR